MNNVKLNFAVKKKKLEKKYKIAYHSACSMQHGQKIHKEPINLIKKTGNEVFEIYLMAIFVVVQQGHIIYFKMILQKIY